MKKTNEEIWDDAPTVSVGVDIGSTTAKLVVLSDGEIVYQRYERHLSRVREKTLSLLKDAETYLKGRRILVAVSGSAGLGMAESAGLPFVQEVFATAQTVRRYEPDTSVVIELGGEDAKIIFFDGGTDERMNGSCAGGTGAFIDQMATLLAVDPDTLDSLSLGAQRLYPIASRCGVFAKTDIQPLLNQGARHEDIAASIYQAVVNQTIAGLAQGRRISGRVLFLGGPLYYCKGLRRRFVETLSLSEGDAVFPDYALYAVSIGAALYAEEEGDAYNYEALLSALEGTIGDTKAARGLAPLFESEEAYRAFSERHARATVQKRDIASYTGDAYLGIDCGSTTTKLVLLSCDKEILYEYYAPNLGNPARIIREELLGLYDRMGEGITIRGSAVTGYGEDMIRAAFGVDVGLVETVAHFTAARHFLPEVDFILDIGGQDIKCFRIRAGAIDSIMLNEACSSGCGSFIETFARSMGMSVDAFAERALFSRAPADLGSRCTVFMNSSVKQAQKDGATVEDISAGLSISVVKNALYKVIRAGSAEELGKNVVVQGGTLYNDAVLRALEMELGREVIRPTVAGLMGAYGAALHAMEACRGTTLIDKEALLAFTHTSRLVPCTGCTNHCHLTVNDFGGRKYISGNRCQRGLGKEASARTLPNLYAYKRERITSLPKGEGTRGTLGLPLALGHYELLPLWHGIFRSLGFSVVVSPMSTRRIYERGQFSIPSDTACYPAKIMHGHIETLLDMGVRTVFYPALSYNVDERESDNFYNCPVVAYYSELLNGNMESLRDTLFLYPSLNVNDRKMLARGLYECLHPHFSVTEREVRRAVRDGFAAYGSYMRDVRRHGEEALAYAEENGLRVMILAGRPYHADAEISHGIDELATSLGFVVVSEDSVAHLARRRPPVHVLNQWTYHARLYRAAQLALERKNVHLVQLVSFGCGLDAITTDEVRSLLEEGGRLYTQIKIDEITNLGAVRIRLRSLIGALDEKERGAPDTRMPRQKGSVEA